MNINELKEEIDNLVGEYIDAGVSNIRPERLGLDSRAGYDLWVSEDRDVIGVKGQSATRNLMYYGGFEYVDEESITRIGDWTFFSNENDRVAGHLDRYEEDENQG